MNTILYAPRMPADPFARSVFIRSLYSRSLPTKRHANAHTLGGGDQRVQRRGPRGGQGAARGRTRAARAHGRTRALRALGPFGPLGPLGAKGDRLYATKAMPNGIDNTDERYSVNVSRFPPVWIPYGIAFVGIIYFVQKLPICMRPK